MVVLNDKRDVYNPPSFYQVQNKVIVGTKLGWKSEDEASDLRDLYSVLLT